MVLAGCHRLHPAGLAGNGRHKAHLPWGEVEEACNLEISCRIDHPMIVCVICAIAAFARVIITKTIIVDQADLEGSTNAVKAILVSPTLQSDGFVHDQAAPPGHFGRPQMLSRCHLT
jgi:hypothetical protein